MLSEPDQTGPTAAPAEASIRPSSRQPQYRPQLGGTLNRASFALIGLRPPTAEHTAAEGGLLQRYARGRRSIVEIGVAEGGSAWEMRSVMAPAGILYLIDPYSLSRVGRLSPKRLVAHRLVGAVRRGRVVWIELPSQRACQGWCAEIDFLFIDGDHAYEAVRADWEGWTPHLASAGHVALHDASLRASWTTTRDGPVRLVEELRGGREWQVVQEVDSLVVLRRS